jgi:hypothetical protein
MSYLAAAAPDGQMGHKTGDRSNVRVEPVEMRLFIRTPDPTFPNQIDGHELTGIS